MWPTNFASRDLMPDRADHSWRMQHRRWILLLLALFMLGTVAACANKAKVIQAGAKQFEAEALVSIDKINAIRLREVSSPASTPAEAEAQFAKMILGSKSPITLEKLDFLLDPNDIGPLGNEAKWQQFLAKLRAQYRLFAAIFSNLDQGSLLSAPTVKEAIPVLDPLIGQMSAFAQVVTRAPVKFISERADLAVRIEAVRNNTQTEEQKRQDLSVLRQELVSLAAAEKEMNESVIAQCLKTATLGRELRGLLQDYDKLSIDGISNGLEEAFALANTIPGLNLEELQGQTTEFLDAINKDPELKKALDDALTRIPHS